MLKLKRTLAFILFLALAWGLVACDNKIPEEPSQTQSLPPSTQAATQATTQATNLTPLTGLPGLPAEALAQRPLMVVVENSPKARPQWGLCSPDIIMECIVEGGISRMLWLYADSSSIPKIGPVRSARHDFVEMAEGLDAIFIHWGWSEPAKQAIKERKVDHINGLDGKYFYRDNSRKTAMEHRGYTDGQSISRALADKNLQRPIKSQYANLFAFAGQAYTPGDGEARGVHFEFSQSYKYEFKYKADDKLYYNHLNNKPVTQDGGQQMAVSNVLVLYCPTKVIDSQGRVDMDLSGGEGVFLSHGAYENIRWEKGNNPSDTLRLFDSAGAGLKLNPGKSYMAFVPVAQKGKTRVLGE